MDDRNVSAKLSPRPELSKPATTLTASAVEVRESVVGFKTLQSRIVGLPCGDGKWSVAGTLIVCADDEDHRQQVAIPWWTRICLDLPQAAAALDPPSLHPSTPWSDAT